MQKDKCGEVDTEGFFTKMLGVKGINIRSNNSSSRQLKATQTESVGEKLGCMTKALQLNPNHPAITAPINVSSDGYVLDTLISELVNVSNKLAQDIGV